VTALTTSGDHSDGESKGADAQSYAFKGSDRPRLRTGNHSV